ncbi:MAG: hypothetical protein KDI63_01385 [Gammaproteobacteria bacterium]|nr:hypothetical protein [Gammaproteobacteria bacterium]
MAGAPRVVGVLLMFASAHGWAGESSDALSTGAENGTEVRLYRTQAERREVGVKRRITPWLNLSGLVEIDLFREEYHWEKGHEREIERQRSVNVQLDLVAAPASGGVQGELVVEYDTEAGRTIIDEGILALESDPWELEIGMQYTPFGEYISHFATGPLVEFGETRAPALLISYSADEQLDSAVSLYRSSARYASEEDRLNLAFAVSTWVTDSIALGLSYQSDLGDSDARLPRTGGDRRRGRVPGLGGYLLATLDRYEFTLEILGATRAFPELPPGTDRPWAWNLELVHFPGPTWEWALRLEGSRELRDKPRIQVGGAVTWRIGNRASLTLEYLHGWMDPDIGLPDDAVGYRSVDRLGTQLSIAF